MTVPDRAQVVVIGGGVMGASTAYHLTRLGWTDVLVLEQGRLSSGTTWHAAGLVGQLRASESQTRLVQYSTQLYAELEAETGLSTGYKQCGGLTVARTPERMTYLRRTVATAAAYDLACELLTPSQAGERYPLLRTDDLVGAIWLPGDGKANPTDLTQSLAKGARSRGARILEKVRVTGIRVEQGRVTGVEHEGGEGGGTVECDVVVNCAGQWAKQVGDLVGPSGATVPLHSAEHFYVVTEPFAGVDPDLPVLRDPDGYIYVKEEVGGLVVGGFEPDAKPWVSPDEIPYPFEFQLLEEDWEHFAVLMESGLHRLPRLEEVGIRKFYNGPESFTPDGNFLLGPAPEVSGLYVGAGFNSAGIASAGGAGRALAEWVVAGEPTSDLTSVDVRRFSRREGNVRWLRDRVSEVLGLHYAVPWPNREMTSARPLRRSPLHLLLEQRGACFGSRNGWERPLFVAAPGDVPELDYTWGKPAWLRWSVAEQVSTRQGVTVFDQTSFSKYVVSGPQALDALQWLCTNDVDVLVGRVVYTGLLNAGGTYEADVTVTRTAPDAFLVVSSAATTTRDLDHLRRHLDGRAASVVDVTSATAVLGVMGPRSRELLGRLSDADLSEPAYPFGSSREIGLGHATVRATRVSYVGELGWELHVPTELALGVADDLLAVGEDLGVRLGGYYAIESLRLEKGYRAFGRELTPAYGPAEAGLLFTCKRDLPFLGGDAVEASRAARPSRRLVSFVVDDPEPMLWGGELLLRDGAPIGQVTSAAWGETVGACVGLGYVDPWDPQGAFEVDVAGERFPLSVSLRAPLR